MSDRSVYLAKSRTSQGQRAHFSIFIPNAIDDRPDLTQNFKAVSCKGSVIHVVGEPVMSGYNHQFKRNFECSTEHDLRELVFLGHVHSDNVFDVATSTYSEEGTPRARLEREAIMVLPPPRGQDVRAPIDGVTTRRCQEWTMEFIQRLVAQSLIDQEAINVAQSHRDSPTHGIFGQKATT